MFKIAKPFIALFVAAMVVACSGNNSRREAAAGLVAQARSLSDSHQYDSALVVLDTLNVKYRDCLEERREGTMVRLAALSALTRDSIAAGEIWLRAVTSEVDSLAPLFRKVEVEGTEGFFVDKNVYTGSEMNVNGIQARVDDQGYCFVIAGVADRKIGLQSISYADVSTPKAKSIEIEGSEIMSLTQEVAAPLLNALSSAGGSAKVILEGSKGKVAVTLNSKQIEAIKGTWRYAKALQLQRLINIRLEKFERQLARLSDQIASQTPVPDEEE